MMISTTCMEFSRSLASPGLACELQHREQLNQVITIVITIKIMLIIILMAKVTHWLDGSNIYGSTEEEANGLRAAGGRFNIIIIIVIIITIIIKIIITSNSVIVIIMTDYLRLKVSGGEQLPTCRFFLIDMMDQLQMINVCNIKLKCDDNIL